MYMDAGKKNRVSIAYHDGLLGGSEAHMVVNETYINYGDTVCFIDEEGKPQEGIVVGFKSYKEYVNLNTVEKEKRKFYVTIRQGENIVDVDAETQLTVDNAMFNLKREMLKFARVNENVIEKWIETVKEEVKKELAANEC